MKRKLMIALLAFLLSVPMLTLAQHGSKYYDDNVTVYVNTEAFGVHKEYDKDRGCYVWKNSMGSFICLDKNMKPLEEMDKHVYFTGTNNDPDNPKVSPFSDVRKVWDKKRGCYVWKNIYTGDFLGTDKASVHAQEQQKQKEQQKQNQKVEKKEQPKKEEKVAKQEQKKKESEIETVNKAGKMLITTDEQMRQAEAALKEAKAQVAAARAQGIDLSEYGIDEYIKQAEDAINEYKRMRK